MDITIKTPNLKETLSKLNALPQQTIKKTVNQGLRSWGEVVSTASKRRCPVATGNLRASIYTSVNSQNTRSELIIGAVLPYAIYVHENLKAHHPVGEAKFIEKSINENLGNLDTTVAKYVDEELKKI